MRYIIYMLAILTGMGILFSCSDTCTDNKNTLPCAGFYVVQDGAAVKATVSNLKIYGVGAPYDSVLYDGTEALKVVYLPFRIDSDTTKYVFAELSDESELTDTVTFIYSRTPVFVSVECGVSYIFDIRQIRTSGAIFDSVTCPDGFINNVNKENLQIYLANTASSE